MFYYYLLFGHTRYDSGRYCNSVLDFLSSFFQLQKNRENGTGCHDTFLLSARTGKVPSFLNPILTPYIPPVSRSALCMSTNSCLSSVSLIDVDIVRGSKNWKFENQLYTFFKVHKIRQKNSIKIFDFCIFFGAFYSFSHSFMYILGGVLCGFCVLLCVFIFMSALFCT